MNSDERDLLERDLDDALRERDELQEIADKLAYAIAPEEVIGEHTTGNDPWQNALDYLDVRDADAEKRGAVKALSLHAGEMGRRAAAPLAVSPGGLLEAAGHAKELANRIESGQVTL